MAAREPDALWEQALQQEEDVDRLADQVVAAAVNLAGGDPETLARFARRLAQTPYLGRKPAASYLVTWETDAEAGSPLEAARQAREDQLRNGTWAVVFDVTDTATGKTTRVDLLKDSEGEEFPYCADHGGPPHRHDSDGEPSI